MSVQLIFALLLATPVSPASSDPAQTMHEPTDSVVPAESHRDIVYLTPDGYPLHLDVYTHPRASARPSPVLIYFHGGAWWKGARPETWKGFASYLAAGFSIVTVQYRLAGTAVAPAAVQDVRCAISWVGKNAARFGFDPARIVVSGTSAGGHLALLAGMLDKDNDIDLPECRDVSRAAAILDFYGPTSLETWTQAEAPHPSIARWIGDRADADSMKRKMSPTTYVRSNLPPIFIAHGDADPVVPLTESIELKNRLDAAGVPNELHIVPGGAHGKFPADQQRTLDRRLLEFLRRQRVID